MDQTNYSQHEKDSEISLKELIVSLQGWIGFLVKRWKGILLVALIGGGGGFVMAMQSKPKYIAGMSFVLEDSKSSALGGYANLASQFGIDLSGNAGSGIFSGENIIEFLRSRLMIEQTLLSPSPISPKDRSMADDYIAVNKLADKWHEKSHLAKIRFPPNVDRKTFTRVQDSILFVIYDRMTKKELTVQKPDKKLSFISVGCQSPDELFAAAFVTQLVNKATDFYVQTKTQRSKAVVDKLQSKADSLELLLNKKTYSAAASQDLNLNPARSLARVGTEVVFRDKAVLQTMFAEVLKNLEVSKMSMAQETPIIQIVDTPILPLKKVKLGYMKAVVIGTFLGGFFSAMFIILRRVYLRIMHDDTKN